MKVFLSYLFIATTLLSPLNLQAQGAPGKIDDSMIHVGANAPTNYVKNPSAVYNVSGITLSSATGTRDTDTADKLDGKASWLCDSSSQNGYCEWDSNTIQEGDKTGNCEAKAQFKGDASLYKLQIHDGSNVLASSSVLPNVTDWTSVSVNYPCGTTRKVRLTQTESGTGAAVNIGRVYWGQATNLGVANQSQSCQTVTMTSSWVTNTTVTAIECRAADRAFYRVKAAVAGGAPTAATLTFTLPSGRVIDTTKLIGTAAAISPLGDGRANDSGSNIYGVGVAYSNSTTVTLRSVQAGTTYVDFNAALTNSAPFSFNDGDSVEAQFEVPIVGWGAQAVVNDNITPWYIDAKIGGANPDLGTSNQTSYVGIESASLTMTPTSGSAPVGIMCSSTNAAASPTTGTSVCSSGSESLSANFNIPNAGVYEVCWNFSHYVRVDQGESAYAYFQTYETPTNAQTLTTAGLNVLSSGSQGMGISGGVDQDSVFPLRHCSNFNWTSSGTKGVRLMYTQVITGAVDTNVIYGDESGTSNGSRRITLTVNPVTASSPMPLLTGSVTSNSSGLERIERAYVNCDASSVITSQSGSWISSIGNISSNRCTVTIAAGIFSSAPTCTAQVADSSINTVYSTNLNVVSATSLTLGCVAQSGATTTACSAGDYNLLCIGPR
jgi:hypothetical protein